MSSLVDEPGSSAPADIGHRFIESLAIQDFDGLASGLSDDVRLRALLPGDTKEWHGTERVKAVFMRWFDNTNGYELAGATVDELGSRLHMSWRVRVRADRLGDGWFTVEQHAYADTDEHNRISHLWLACSGYIAEE